MRTCYLLDGIVFLKMVALKPHDVSDQQLSILGGHPDEPGVETVRIAWDRKGIEPQHLDSGFEGDLVGEEECEGKGLIWLVGGRDRYADPPAAEVHGFLRECTLCRVGL